MTQASPLSAEEREARINQAHNVTPNQARFIADLVDQRFEVADPAREELRQRYQALRSHADASAMIEDLKKLPTLVQKRANLARTQRPEEGFYRNPETGELFRLRYAKGGQVVVSKYSKTGGLRRLSTEGNLVKGSWKKLPEFHTRLMLMRGELPAEWHLTEDELTEYAYGFCPYHGGPLTDGVSVALGYGKTCAQRQGLPWGEEVARAFLAGQEKGGGAV